MGGELAARRGEGMLIKQPMELVNRVNSHLNQGNAAMFRLSGGSPQNSNSRTSILVSAGNCSRRPMNNASVGHARIVSPPREPLS